MNVLFFTLLKPVYKFHNIDLLQINCDDIC